MSDSKRDSRSKQHTVDCEENRNKRMSLIGLQNLRNTSCLNSVLQNLLYLRPFMEQLHYTMTRTECKLVPKKHPDLETLTFAYSDKESEPGKLTKELYKLLYVMVGKSGKFSDGTEQDSYEMLCFLIDMVKDEEIQRLKTAFFVHFDINNHTLHFKNYPEDGNKLLRKYAGAGTFIDDTFGGKMISTVKCDNSRKTLNINEDFLDTSLHSSVDSKEDSQIGNPSYNQLRNEIESKSEEAEISHKNSSTCNPQIASKQDEDSNSESGEDKGKKEKSFFNAPISTLFNFVNNIFCKKRCKDAAAAESQKRQKQSDDWKDNITENMYVIGLYNLGNTCYFNSVLQNLLYLRPFREQLSYTMTRTKYKLVPKKNPELKTIEFSSEKKSEPGKLTQELFNLIQETVYQCEATEETSKNLKYDQNNSRKVFTRKTVKPRAVQEKILNKHVKFSDGSQQDSHELFRFMIDMVKDEEIKRLKTAFLKHFNIKNDKTQSMNYSVDEKNLKKYASEFDNIFVFTGTFIDDTFGGKIISTVKCEGCGNILDVNEDFLDISLPLPEYSPEDNILSSNQPRSEIESNSEEEVKVKYTEVKRLNNMPNGYPKDSLEYYLMRFFSPIFLKEDYVCNNCNPQLINKHDDTSDTSSDESDDSDNIDYDVLKFTSAEKQFRIKTVGPVLTIHLNRFSQTGYGLKKMNEHVEFPLLLDMSPFCVSNTSVLKDCDDRMLYGLRGIVSHLGGMLGGHYVAYVNIADWNVPSKISSSDSSKSRIVEKSSGKRNSTDQPMDTDPAQENRMPLTSENSKCEPSFQPTPPLKHVTPTEEWYYISDSYVSRANHGQVFSSQAYILFYERLPLVTKDTHV